MRDVTRLMVIVAVSCLDPALPPIAAATPCVGLPTCPTPPPDAEGNPACYYRDGWEPDPSGSGINVYYFREVSNMSNPEQVTADIRMKDGTTASQIASIDPGQPVNQFQFPGIDKAAVQACETHKHVASSHCTRPF